MKFRNLLLFTMVVFLSGFNWVAIKTALGYIAPTEFALQRFIVGAAVMLPAVIILKKNLPKDRKTMARLVPFALIYAALVLVQSVGLVGESVGIAAVITYSQPLIVFCVAVPLLGERATINKVLGTIVGFAGVVVLFISRMNSFILNSTIATLITAFLWAATVLYYKKYLSHVDASTSILFQLSIGIVPLFIVNLPGPGLTFPGDPFFIFLIVFSAVAGLSLGNSVWFFLLRQEEASTLSSSSLIIPAITLILGWQILGEKLSPELLVGAALTLIGVSFMNLKRNEVKNSSKLENLTHPQH